MAKLLADMLATRANALDYANLLGTLPNPDPILRAQGKSIAVYRDLRSDAHVGACCRRRKSSVKSLEWGLDRGKARSGVAKAIEAILADIDLERLIGDCMEAVLYGYQPIEIGWQKVGSLIVPAVLEAKPQEWFVFDPDNQLRLRTKTNPWLGEALPDRKFLLPRQDATYQNPYGFADLSMCFWPIVFKKGGVKFWLKFAEKFGMPMPIGKQPRGASEAEREALLDSLDAMVQDGVAVIPDDSSVDLLETKGSGGGDAYEKLVMYCRSEVSIALTGTNQTTEASVNKASAQAGLDVAHDIRDGDGEVVAAAVNQLIRWICEINYGGVERPLWSFWDKQVKDELQAARDKSNYEAGARYTNAYFQRAYGYQDGDLAESSPPVPVAAAAPLAGAPGKAEVAAFAEPPDMALADQLAEAAATPWQKVVEQVQGMVATAPDLPTLQDTLLAAYGELDTARLTEIMAAGFALAELRGMSDARAASSVELADPAPVPIFNLHATVQKGDSPMQPTVTDKPGVTLAEPGQAPVINLYATLQLPESFGAAPVTLNIPPAPAPVVNVSVPEQPAPVVHVTTPEPVVHVNVPVPVVNVAVPEQPAPVVNVAVPLRQIDTTVVRDAAGAIVRATQIEHAIEPEGNVN